MAVRASRRLGFVAAGILLLACVAPGGALAAPKVRDRVDLLEQDVRDLQQRLVQLQQSHDALEAEIKDMRAALGLDAPGHHTPADLAARLDTVEGDLRVVTERQGQSEQRLAVIADKLDALFQREAAQDTARAAQAAGMPPPGGEPGNPLAPGAVPGAPVPPGSPLTPPPSGAPLLDPEELYQSARADYGRGSYDLAISGFREYLSRFPASELASNAQYWLAESLYSQGKFQDALDAFGEVGHKYPLADKVPDAEYKEGLCLLELNHPADGIIQLQKVRDSHPNTAAAGLARQKLQALGLM